jgi:hypothetical protein
MTARFTRRGDVVELDLGVQERRIITAAVTILEEVDPGDGDDPGAARLSYSAHPEDAGADRRFRDLTGGMLADGRRRDRAAVTAGLHRRRLTIEDAESWLRVIGEARLVLGARAGIETDGWQEAIAAAGPVPADVVLVEVLGWLQDALVDALGDAS